MSNRAKLNALVAKRDKLNVEIAELEVLAANEIDTSTIEVGTRVVANYGRGDKARSVVAEVLGVRREEGKATLFKAKIGEGFDAEIVTLFESQVTGLYSEPSDPQE